MEKVEWLGRFFFTPLLPCLVLGGEAQGRMGEAV